MELQEKIKMYLENSPQIDSLPNPDLLGYRFADWFVCAKCAQRIMMRGCWGYLEPSVVVWSDSGAHGCCLGCDELSDLSAHLSSVQTDSLNRRYRHEQNKKRDQ